VTLNYDSKVFFGLEEVHWDSSVGIAAGLRAGSIVVGFTKVLVIYFRLCIHPDFGFVQLFMRCLR
jgi:hypothetical protein